MAKKIPRMGVCFVAYAGVLIARCINLWRAVPSILLLAHAGSIVITSPITEKLIVYSIYYAVFRLRACFFVFFPNSILK